MRIDASDALRVAAQFAASPAVVRAATAPVVSKGALNVKNEWNRAFWASRSFKGVGGSVDYDIKMSPGGVEAEVGPNKSSHWGTPGPGKSRPAAPLANIAHFGGARGGGSVADPQTFADQEAPKFEKALEQVIKRSLP